MTMPTILSMIAVAPPLPYGYLWEILFAAILGLTGCWRLNTSLLEKMGIALVCSRSCGDDILV